MRLGGFVLAALAAGAIGLPVASPALAAVNQEQPLDEQHQQRFARDFDQRCAQDTGDTGEPDARMADRAPYQDGWVFQLSGTGLESLTVTFAPGGDLADDADRVVITGTVADSAGPIQFYPERVASQDAYLFTPAGWLLVTATAELADGTELVVQHTCAGDPDDSDSAAPMPEPLGQPPSSAAPTTSAPPAQAPPAGAHTGSPAGLPITGAQVGGLVLLGGGMLAGGIALLAVRRRSNLNRLLDEP